MRIRAPFAGAFLCLLLASAYFGLTSVQVSAVNDKVLHFIDFFLLTVCFYWVLDTSRRRCLNYTLIVCTAFLGLGSEVVQGVLPNGRLFDPYDIVANVLGSLSALALCSWYHKRMLERKRLAKQYHIVPTGDDVDLELGEGVGGEQETGVTDAPAGAGLEAEVDNWDENAEDAWDGEEDTLASKSARDGQTALAAKENVKTTPDTDRRDSVD